MTTDPNEIQSNGEETNDDEILAIKCDAQKALSRFYVDMYNIERLKFQAFVRMLRDAKIIPTVAAAPPPVRCRPAKPPPMKYTDLPLYKSPHKEYKEYVDNKHNCPKARVKLVHEYLYPHIRCCRKQFQKTYADTRCTIQSTAKDICTTICENKRDFKQKMRCPENLAIRQAVVLFGGTTGFILGGRNVPRRLFFSSVGLLATGALCFPVETDVAFRSLVYYSVKLILGIYNGICNKGLSLGERVTCSDDMPPQKPIRNLNPCPKKKGA